METKNIHLGTNDVFLGSLFLFDVQNLSAGCSQCLSYFVAVVAMLLPQPRFDACTYQRLLSVLNAPTA